MTLTIDYKVPDKRVMLAIMHSNEIFVEPSEEDYPLHAHVTSPVTNHAIAHLHIVQENGLFFLSKELRNSGWEEGCVVGELVVACRRCVEKLADIYLPRTPHPPLFMMHRCLVDCDGRVYVSFFITKLYGFEYKDGN